MEQNEIDFKSIDERTNFKRKSQREMAAQRDGFNYISEHIVMTYRETRSLRETGKRCGDISTIAVRAVLSKCGETLRQPGGRVWSKLSEDDVLYIRSFKNVNNQVFISIASEIQKRVSNRLGRDVSVSVETIRDVWKNKTHKNIK